MITEHDRSLLLELARETIAAHVKRTPPPAAGSASVMSQPGGAFVTLHRHGGLRGCIGHIEADDMIGRIVARCAVAACSSDPRFPPVTVDELEEIEIEISLLGPLEAITGPEDVEVGRHGLVVEMGWQRGLLLPQVATEWQWDAGTFLAQTCHKAGLPKDAWKTGARMWRFSAEVFGETLGSNRGAR